MFWLAGSGKISATLTQSACLSQEIQLLKGAALNAVQIAEMVLAR